MTAKNTKIIGRCGCKWCGFESAHVKQSPDKHPYHHCPQCGIMTHAKNGHQAALLTSKMRPEPNYQEQAEQVQQRIGAATDGPQPPETTDPIIVKGGVKLPDPPKKVSAAPAVVTPQNWASALLGG